MNLKLTEEIRKEDDMFVSFCPELDVASCGNTIEEAKKNLKEAIQINIEETKKMGTFSQFMENAGFITENKDTYTIRKSIIGFYQIEVPI